MTKTSDFVVVMTVVVTIVIVKRCSVMVVLKLSYLMGIRIFVLEEKDDFSERGSKIESLLMLVLFLMIISTFYEIITDSYQLWFIS